ncbi:MAG TPA: MFS transporter [Gemmatimonadales bacterium]|nr:MFS transporter [Gemmatimonadales bacterium]
MADPQSVPAAPSGARYAIIVLTAMNLLNYIDRYVPSAVKPLFQRELGFTDAQTAYPLTAFVLVYMLTSPIFGSLADRMSRKLLIALGVALWSLATAGGALATGLTTFILARALVGVGEAAYATIAPSLISDYFPPGRRNRMLTIFYVAIPVGAALGFTLGGLIGNAYGWRTALLIVGLPGLIAAGMALLIKEPVRGAFDPVPAPAVPSWPDALRVLRRTAPYLFAVAGYIAVTWAGGGMADWFATYLVRVRGMELSSAAGLTGAATVVGGLAGTLTGGLMADRLKGKTRSPYFALSCLTMIPAAGFALLALTAGSRIVITGAIVLAQFFMWCYNGPINAIIVNAVPAGMRARAVSMSILSIHLFGDAISPTIIGVISDRTGNLFNGMVLIPGMMVAGAVIWAVGWRTLNEEGAGGRQQATGNRNR